jgi:hypothetical protein
VRKGARLAVELVLARSGDGGNDVEHREKVRGNWEGTNESLVLASSFLRQDKLKTRD